MRLKGTGREGVVGAVPKALDRAEPGVGGDVTGFEAPNRFAGLPKTGGGVAFSASSLLLALSAEGLPGRTAAAGLGVGGGF